MTARATTSGLQDKSPDVTTLQYLQWAIAAGTADIITARYPAPVTAFEDGMVLAFRASAANATTTPTFAPDDLPAYVLTKWGGQALGAGNIRGNGHEILVRLNAAQHRWEIVNL